MQYLKNLGLFLVLALLLSSVIFAEEDKSAVRGEVISLPGAGGSIKKEKGAFSSSAYNGAATFQLPIDLPKGPGGVKPPLEISYSSLSGNGPLGLGWRLSPSQISVKQTKGVPTYSVDDSGKPLDSFELDGVALIFSHLKDGKFFYKLEKAERFQTIYYQVDLGWTVQKNDGATHIYQTTACSTISEFSGEICAQADQIPQKIAQWNLTKVIDRHQQNVILYSYARPSFMYGQQRINRKPVLTQVKYGNVTVALIPMEQQRSDSFVSFSSGYPVGSFGLYDGILVKFDETVVRQYCFVYEQGAGATGSSLIFGKACNDSTNNAHAQTEGLENDPTIHTTTYLRKVIKLGSASPLAESNQTYPSISFRYSSWFKGDVSSDRRQLVYKIRNFKSAMIDPAAGVNELIDINQDGLPDILKNPNSQAFLWVKNLGMDMGSKTGQLNNVRFPAAVSPNLVSDFQHMADMNGDGIADYVVFSAANELSYYPAQVSLQSTANPWRGTPVSMPLPNPLNKTMFTDRRSKLVDLNGDGLTDILTIARVSGGQRYIFALNQGGEKFTKVQTAAFLNCGQPLVAAESCLSQDSLRLQDMNGDGLIDIVRLEKSPAGLRIFYNQGTFESTPTSPQILFAGLNQGLAGDFIPIYFNENLSEVWKRAWIVDANGDGLVDIVNYRYSIPRKLDVWLNRGGGKFDGQAVDYSVVLPASATTIESTQLNRVRIADIDGDGQQEVIFFSRSDAYMIDFNRQMGVCPGSGSNTVECQLIKSGLLTTVQYESGKRIDIQYTTAADEFHRDEKSIMGAKQYRNNSYLPFASVLVKRVVITEGAFADRALNKGLTHIPAVVEEYLYHDGFYDRQRKEFTGFGRVEHIIYGDQNSETLYEIFDFHNGMQGGAAFLMAGKQKAKETFPLANDAVYQQQSRASRAFPFHSAFAHSLSKYSASQILPQAMGMAYSKNQQTWEIRAGLVVRVQDLSIHSENGRGVAASVNHAFDYDKFGNVTREQKTILTPVFNADGFQSFDQQTLEISTDFDAAIAYLQAAHIFNLPASRVKKIAGKILAQQKMAYNQVGDLIQETGFLGATHRPVISTSQYDTFGNLIGKTDYNGNKTSFKYDATGTFLVAHSNAKNHLKTAVYACSPDFPSDMSCENDGLLHQTTDENGIRSFVAYDDLHRPEVIQKFAPDQQLVAKILFAYKKGEGGEPIRIMEVEQVKACEVPTFDCNFRKVEFYRPNGKKIAKFIQVSETETRVHHYVIHNRKGDVVGKYVPFIVQKNIEAIFEEGKVYLPSADKQISYQYDSMGRASKITYPYGTPSQTFVGKMLTEDYIYHYTWGEKKETLYGAKDGRKDLITITYKNSQKKVVGISQVADGATRTFKFAYNGLQKVTQVINPLGLVTAKTYDWMGYPLSIKHPDVGEHKFEHDGNGNVLVKTIVGNKGQTVGRLRMVYDPLNRLLEKYHDRFDSQANAWVNALQPKYLNRYDGPNNCLVAEPSYNLGQKTQMEIHDAAYPMVVKMDYNQAGQPFCEIKKINDRFYQRQSTFDMLGREITKENEFGHKTVYQYGADQYIRSVSGVIDRASYNEKGQVKVVAYQDSKLITEYVYDPSSLMIKKIVTRNPAGQVLQDLQYTMDGLGNIEEVIDSVDENWHANLSATYAYDGFSQLVKFDTPEQLALDYEYDLAGRMVKNSNFDGTDPLIYNADIKGSYVPLGSANKQYRYDERGNLIQSPQFESATFDIENRLIALKTKDTVHQFGYDSEGKRYYKNTKFTDEAQPQLDIFLSKDAHVIGSIPVSYVLLAGKRLAKIDHTPFTNSPDKVQWMLLDHLSGSNIAIDAASGQAVEQIVYRPYGNERHLPDAWKQHELNLSDSQRPDSPIDHRFAGHYRDVHSGLYYYGQRYYDPQIGRFISPDPVFFEKLASCVKSPIECNLYQYAANNPMKYNDTDGTTITIGSGGGPFSTAQYRARAQTELQRIDPSARVNMTTGRVSFASGTSTTGHTQGHALLNRMVSSTQDVRVDYQQNGAAIDSNSVNWANAQNGTGSGSTVQWDPSLTAALPELQQDGSILRTNVSSHIALGHELIHGDHIQRGDVNLSGVSYTGLDGSSQTSQYQEEPRTVGVGGYNTSTSPTDVTENNLRQESGLKPRAYY